MGYINDTFGRMELQQIREFLLYGTENYFPSDLPYNQRLKSGSNTLYERINRLYPDQDERDKAAADIAEALSAYEGVYMELGMKAGARLLFQLLLEDSTVPPCIDDQNPA